MNNLYEITIPLGKKKTNVPSTACANYSDYYVCELQKTYCNLCYCSNAGAGEFIS